MALAGCLRLFSLLGLKTSDWVGTILASLGVAFRFLTLAGQADAQTLGGIYEVPPFFCSPAPAHVQGPCCAKLGLVCGVQ